MKIVTMKQLRQKFSPVRKGLDRGEEYLLMYRAKPLAVIRPYSADQDAQHLSTSVPSEEQPVARTEDKLVETTHESSDNTTNPLEKLRMKRAFV